jgi:hydroxypyruvate reductase
MWIEPKKLLKECFSAMVRAVDPNTLVQQALRYQGSFLYVRGEPVIDLGQVSRVWLAGLGKASMAMVKAAQAILGDRIYRGLLVSPVPAELAPPLQVVVGSHPLPDERSLDAGEQLFAMISSLEREDLLLFFLSGGGSSLAVLPVEGITLAEKQAAMQVLLRSPLSITQVNAVRKRLSRLKGGGLARAAFPATVWNFVLSDVVGDDLGTVASGPFQPARESADELHSLLRNEGLLDRLPDAVNRVLLRPFPFEESAEGFSWVHNILLGGNLIALRAGKDFFKRAGVPCLILSAQMEGEVQALANSHAQTVREALRSGRPISPPCALLSGGESFLQVHGSGQGGRNQEFALYFAQAMEGCPGRWWLLSAGTDGIDGPTDAAGAIIDESTLARARTLGLSSQVFLADNDSYSFFQRVGGLLRTGPTGTNVADVRLILLQNEGVT